MAMFRIATPFLEIFIRKNPSFYRIFRIWQIVFDAIDNRGANWHFNGLATTLTLEFIVKRRISS